MTLSRRDRLRGTAIVPLRSRASRSAMPAPGEDAAAFGEVILVSAA
jgi:hypothetical protein